MNRDLLIKKLQLIQVVPELAASVSFTVKTKAASFINLVIPQNGCQVVITVYEDTYDASIATSIEQTVLTISNLPKLGSPARIKLEGHSKFDEIVCLRPLAHRFWKADKPALWESTYVCFPIMHYELPLNCSEAEIEFLRDRGPLNSSDWNRRTVPIIYIAYENVCNGEGTVSKKPKLGSYDDLSKSLKSISEYPHFDNWISIESWRHEKYVIKYDASLNVFNITDLSEKTQKFFHNELNYFLNDLLF